MPEPTPTQQKACQYWQMLGNSAKGNPVIAAAYELFFKPCGINAQDFSYDVFEARLNPQLTIVFTEPAFDDTLVNKSWSQYKIIEPMLKIHKWLEPVIEPDGVIRNYEIIQSFSAADSNDTSMIGTFIAEGTQAGLESMQNNFINKHSPIITELTESLRDCAKQYIDQALTLLLTEPMSEERCNFFLQNPSGYAAAAWSALSANQE